jgi:hypothetical protein
MSKRLFLALSSSDGRFRNFFKFVNFKNTFLKISPISPGFEGNGDESDENGTLFFAHFRTVVGGG